MYLEILKLLRVKQWIKNFFVFGALIFSFNFNDINSVISSFKVFLLFSLISSSVYILNDIVDVNRDKAHPTKKFRPIASGKVSIKNALLVFAFLFLTSISLSILVNKYVTIVLLVYFVNNLFYSFKLKHVVILDVFLIAFGFILRVVAGGLAIDVVLSPWILLCTLFISLFLGFEKRKAELITLGSNSSSHRNILSSYSVEFLNELTTISSTCTIVFYSLYTILQYPDKPMFVTSFLVAYGVFRYKYLIHKKGHGGSPTETVLTDKSIIFTVFIWICASVFILIK